MTVHLAQLARRTVGGIGRGVRLATATALLAAGTACSVTRPADRLPDLTAKLDPAVTRQILIGSGERRGDSVFHAPDGTDFRWRRWGTQRPELVLLCVHGLSGAVEDYDYLASQLDLSRFALYSYDLRAMGRDPVPAHRGDLTDRGDWSKDLLAFDAAIRARHPAVPIAWYGESLGALIILQTRADFEVNPVVGVGLASPIVRVRGKLGPLELMLFNTATWFAPRQRMPVSALVGDAPVTPGHTSHVEQLGQTPWAVHSYTLRCLRHMGAMAEDAPRWAHRLDTPALVLHGGADLFENPYNVGRFLAAGSQTDITYHYYSRGYHLLLYDEHYRAQVAGDIRAWLEGLLPHEH